MRKTITAVLALGVMMALGAATLEEASKNISAAIADSKVMTSTMASLSAADQVKFVAAVNKAISKLSGSVEQRTALYLSANEAALKAAAAKANLLPVLAEIFATVPVNSLPMLSERFADAFFNRALNSATTYTDAQVAESSKKVMAAIHEKTGSVDLTEIRDALAIMMLARASNGTPKTMPDDLVMTVTTVENRERMSELVKSAMAGDYETALAEAGDDVQLPNQIQVLRMRDPQLLDALMGDLTGAIIGDAGLLAVPLTEQLFVREDINPAAIESEGESAHPLSDGPSPFNPSPYPGQTR